MIESLIEHLVEDFRDQFKPISKEEHQERLNKMLEEFGWDRIKIIVSFFHHIWENDVVPKTRGRNYTKNEVIEGVRDELEPWSPLYGGVHSKFYRSYNAWIDLPEALEDTVFKIAFPDEIYPVR